MATKSDVKTKIKPNLKIQEPSMYRIIYMNDDVTTIEFVIESLVEYFQYTAVAALPNRVEVQPVLLSF